MTFATAPRRSGRRVTAVDPDTALSSVDAHPVDPAHLAAVHAHLQHLYAEGGYRGSLGYGDPVPGLPAGAALATTLAELSRRDLADFTNFHGWRLTAAERVRLVGAGSVRYWQWQQSGPGSSQRRQLADDLRRVGGSSHARCLALLWAVSCLDLPTARTVLADCPQPQVAGTLLRACRVPLDLSAARALLVDALTPGTC